MEAERADTPAPLSPTRRLWPVAGGAAVLLTAWVLALPSWHGWFNDDDFTNMRWVQEYRWRPLAAIWGRHSVHDHIRPFNLIFHWVGGMISNGDWWGPHAVLVALALGAIAATMGLAAARHGREAAPIAGLLALPIGGFGLLLTWNAWIGSAGEVACGVAAVATAQVALTRDSARWAGLALGLGLAAGLFKEPGWLAYPIAVAAIALPALRSRSASPRVARLLLGTLVVGALGFTYAWHPANLTRTMHAGAPLPTRILEAVRVYGLSLVNMWPFSLAGAGVAAPLLGLAFWREVVPGGLRGRGPVLVALSLATGAAAVVFSKNLGVGMVAAMAIVCLRRLREPPPELVMGLVTIGVMVFNQGPDPVHALTAGLGLAVWTAGHLAAVAREGRGWLGSARGRVAFAAGVVAVGILPIVQTKHAILRAPRPQGNADFRARLTALSGLGQLVHPISTDAEPDAFALAPMMGLPQVIARADGPVVNIAVPGLARLTVLRDAAPKILTDANVMPAALRTVGTTHAAGTAEVNIGSYAAGMAGYRLTGANVRMSLSDACRHEWNAAVPSADTDWASLVVLTVGAGCGPLTVDIDGADASRVEAFLLVPLPAARYTLRSMPDRPDHAEVDERAVPAGAIGPGPK